MPKNSVSLSVIKRLPRYYRYLGELLQNNIMRISSRELAGMMKLTASQIRQDLNCFGGFGQQGYGYNVKDLHDEIGGILGIEKQFKAILIGVGNLGHTIATQMRFEKLGFKLIGAFDKKRLISDVKGIKVQPVEDIKTFCEENHPQIAILCIPKESAMEITPLLIECGIKGFWNFSHYEFAFNYEGIVVENVHLSDSLMTLCYRVKDSLEKSDEN